MPRLAKDRYRMCTEPAQHPAVPMGTPTQQGRIRYCTSSQLLRPPHEVYALDLSIDRP